MHEGGGTYGHNIWRYLGLNGILHCQTLAYGHTHNVGVQGLPFALLPNKSGVEADLLLLWCNSFKRQGRLIRCCSEEKEQWRGSAMVRGEPVLKFLQQEEGDVALPPAPPPKIVERNILEYIDRKKRYFFYY